MTDQENALNKSLQLAIERKNSLLEEARQSLLKAIYNQDNPDAKELYIKVTQELCSDEVIISVEGGVAEVAYNSDIERQITILDFD